MIEEPSGVTSAGNSRPVRRLSARHLLCVLGMFIESSEHATHCTMTKSVCLSA